jgi:hypothetical protein
MGQWLRELRGQLRGLVWLSAVALRAVRERAEETLRQLERRGREGRIVGREIAPQLGDY